MIDTNLITTVSVGELPPADFNLTDNIPHEISAELKRGTVQQLADLIGGYLGTSDSLAFNPTTITDGGALPETNSNEWMLVGKGTFSNVGGGDDIITTEELNALTSNGSYWSLAVQIPINVELAGITQNVRSGYTNTTPSEDAVYNAISNVLSLISNLSSDNILNESKYSGTYLTEVLNNILLYTDNNINYVTPEQYGAVGDGITDDKVAIQNAVNSLKLVRLGSKNYYISGTIQMPLRSSISGNGISSLIMTGGDYPAFEIIGADVSISNLGALGAGKGLSNTNNNGILIQGNYPTSARSTIMLTNVIFGNFSNAGIKQVGITNGQYSPTIIANNLSLAGNNIGVTLDTRAEYNSFSNCIISSNNIGVRMSGGNNNFVGGQINNNIDGVVLLGGENDGHSVMTGVAINHNTGNAIKANGLTVGYLFDACMMYGGGDGNDIEIIDSTGIKISNCDISVTEVNTANSTIEFSNTKWHTTPVFTDNFGSGGVSTIRYFNNYFKAGGAPGTIKSKLLEPLEVAESVTSPAFYGTLVGNAATATGWGSRTADFLSFGTNLDQGIGVDGVTGVVKPFSQAAFKTWVGIASASYTPTLTGISNVTSVTLSKASYTKVGDIVTVTVGFNLTATAINTGTSFSVTFPFNRATSSAYGIGSGNLSNSLIVPAIVNTSNTNLTQVIFNSGAGTGVFSGSVTFQYSVLY